MNNLVKGRAGLFFILCVAGALAAAPSLVSFSNQSAKVYYPGPGDDWERKNPEEAGMDAARLAEAVEFAKASESQIPTDLRQYLESRFTDDPYGKIIGPMRERGATNGMILRHGYIVAEWGDTQRVDMTFSVTKSYLSTLLGLALDAGLVKDVHDRVGDYVHDGEYESEQNRPITCHMSAQQTAAWEGALHGKPDVSDRRRGRDRTLQAPGTFWEYNDVRVNRFALSLLQVWKRPLPEVLQEKIMDPIGASNTWQWLGYDNADHEIGGQVMRSVSGGGHWGDGLFISTRDHARFGLLFLRRGRWKDRQLVSEKWIDGATTPTDVQPRYGYMWWLNTGKQQWPSAPESSYAALGGGGNVIWISPEHDLVVVVRWLDNQAHDKFLDAVLLSIMD